MRHASRTRLLLVVGALVPAAGAVVAATRPACAQAVGAEAQAQQRFTRGRDQFNAGHFEPALSEFRAAQAAFASPNIRLYIARSLRELGRLAEAFGEFQLAAAEASDRAGRDPRYGPTRDAARAEGTALEARVGRLTVHVPTPVAGLHVTVGGAELASSGWDLPTPADPRVLEVAAMAPGRAEFHQQVTVTAGQETQVTVVLGGPAVAVVRSVPAAGPAAADRRERRAEGGGVRVAGFVVTGVGVVSGVLTGVFGAMAQGRYDSLHMMCPAGCGPEIDSQIAEGQSWQLLSTVALVTGIATLAAGVVMIAAGGPHEAVRASTAAQVARREHGAAMSVIPWSAPLGSGAVAGVRVGF